MRKQYPKKKKKQQKPTRQRSGDYRIFIGAFPEGEKIDEIQKLREQVDWKTSQITAPHVTIAGTYWRTGPATAENEADLIAELEKVVPKLRPFTLNLGGIYTFGQRVIYLGVMPSDEMLTLRKPLLRVMGQDKHRQFKPHMTLVMRLNGAEFAEALASLKEGAWGNGRFSTPIHELRLMQRGPNDPAWRTIHTLSLTG